MTGPSRSERLSLLNDRIQHSVSLPELRRDGPIPATNPGGLRAHGRAAAQFSSKTDRQLLRRLAAPGSPHALLLRVLTGPLPESPERAPARDYFVTSLRGGERGGEQPGGRSAAGTSATAGHLRGA